MEQIDQKNLGEIFTAIMQNNLPSDLLAWINEKAVRIREENNAAELYLTFASLPRKTGRHPIQVESELQQKLAEIYQQYSISDWTIDRLCRVWVLLQTDKTDKVFYLSKLQNLFKAAEMNELVALYYALPSFYFAEEWKKQCAEGIRSNIGIVLEAIMYNNPYPYIYLDQNAWNQLVLKAFFTEKDVNRIIGIDDRANADLASILIDYASERWAAHRMVHPQLWRLVAPFITEKNFDSIRRAFNSNKPVEKKAAALACFNSNFEPAKLLLENDLELKNAIQTKNLTWHLL